MENATNEVCKTNAYRKIFLCIVLIRKAQDLFDMFLWTDKAIRISDLVKRSYSKQRNSKERIGENFNW